MGIELQIYYLQIGRESLIWDYEPACKRKAKRSAVVYDCLARQTTSVRLHAAMLTALCVGSRALHISCVPVRFYYIITLFYNIIDNRFNNARLDFSINKLGLNNKPKVCIVLCKHGRFHFHTSKILRSTSVVPFTTIRALCQ